MRCLSYSLSLSLCVFLLFFFTCLPLIITLSPVFLSYSLSLFLSVFLSPHFSSKLFSIRSSSFPVSKFFSFVSFPLFLSLFSSFFSNLIAFSSSNLHIFSVLEFHYSYLFCTRKCSSNFLTKGHTYLLTSSSFNCYLFSFCRFFYLIVRVVVSTCFLS